MELLLLLIIICGAISSFATYMAKKERDSNLNDLNKVVKERDELIKLLHDNSSSDY